MCTRLIFWKVGGGLKSAGRMLWEESGLVRLALSAPRAVDAKERAAVAIANGLMIAGRRDRLGEERRRMRRGYISSLDVVEVQLCSSTPWIRSSSSRELHVFPSVPLAFRNIVSHTVAHSSDHVVQSSRSRYYPSTNSNSAERLLLHHEFLSFRLFGTHNGFF